MDALSCFQEQRFRELVQDANKEPEVMPEALWSLGRVRSTVQLRHRLCQVQALLIIGILQGFFLNWQCHESVEQWRVLVERLLHFAVVLDFFFQLIEKVDRRGEYWNHSGAL